MSTPPIELLDDGERLPVPEELSGTFGVLVRGCMPSEVK